MLTYLHLDVFTDQLFAGNQLAVYLDPPPDLSEPVMQAIAREMAFSETTFVFAPAAPGTDYRVRIFTPASELPMAGHPTIGTAFALVHGPTWAFCARQHRIQARVLEPGASHWEDAGKPTGDVVAPNAEPTFVLPAPLSR